VVGALTVRSSKPWWARLTLSGFARLGVFYTFPLRDEQLVGGNGGFRVADFRLNAEFRPWDDVTAYASVELAAPVADPKDPLVGARVVSLRDAWVQYEVCSCFIFRAVQFRPPYYAERLLSDGAIPFVSRSVLAGGLHPPEAWGTNALAVDRQVGLEVHSKRLGGVFSFRYALGVFNGNGPNQLFNDNNAPMPVGRVELDFKEHVTLGLNAFYDVRAEGTRPTRLYTNHLAYGADLEAHGYGLSGLVAFLGRNSTFNYAALSPESAMGVLGQVRYFHEKTGLEGAARVAWYEPSSAQQDDQVLEVAAMVAWRPFAVPRSGSIHAPRRGEPGLLPERRRGPDGPRGVVRPMRAVSLSFLLAFVASCAKTETPARAFRVQSRSELIGGKRALGEVGDFKLTNGVVHAIIQDVGTSRGFGSFGGSLIDVDLVRGTTGTGAKAPEGNDYFTEMFPAFFLTAIEPRKVEVLADGSDGGAAIVRVSGSSGNFISLVKAITDVVDPKQKLDYHVDYILEPGKQYLKIVTTVESDSDGDAAWSLAVPFGFVTLLSEGQRLFVPGEAGFDMRFHLEDTV
jgi:hypothetical protein